MPPTIRRTPSKGDSSGVFFQRMFPELPPFEAAEGTLAERTAAIERLAARTSARSSDRDNPRIPAGYTYLGQLLAHDLSFDAAPLAEPTQSLEDVRSLRSPRIDLDGVYGGGPKLQPYLYKAPSTPHEPACEFELTTSPVAPGRVVDLPRSQSGCAIVPDPRSDVHRLVRELHLAVASFHNQAVAALRQEKKTPEDRLFEEARRLTTWHFQWVILTDYLARITGVAMTPKTYRATLEKEFDGGPRSFVGERNAAVPVEFSAGVFRFGHGMIRSTYRLNGATDPGPIHFEPRFTKRRSGSEPTMIAWHYFVPGGAMRPQFSQRIGPSLAPVLHRLPEHPDQPKLGFRDYRRSWQLRLPSGQSVARALGMSGRSIYPGNHSLWYYVLKEALAFENGLRLGKLGRRLLLDVLVGILEQDKTSFLAADPHWIPSLTPEGAGTDLAAFLRFAQMPMDDEDLPGWARPESGRVKKTDPEDPRGGGKVREAKM